MTRPANSKTDRLLSEAARLGISPAALMARCEREFILNRYDNDPTQLPPGVAKCVKELEYTIMRG